MELYVGNLIYTMTDSELRELFSSHGSVIKARIINDHFTRQSKCFGYVEMMHRKDGHQAMKSLHGKNINDRLLIVKEARSRHDRQGQGW